MKKPCLFSTVAVLALAFTSAPARAELEGGGNSGGSEGTFGAVSTGSASATGAATTSFAFLLPRARGRAQPSLGLHYNSASLALGEAGVGWSLGTLPLIERRSMGGAPRFDAEDFFEVGGARLVPTNVREHCLVVEFQPPTTIFCPVGAIANPMQWIVYTRGGTTTTYDLNVADEGPQGVRYRWYPTSTADVDVNRVVYRWQTQGGLNQVLGLSHRKYLTDIFDTPELSGQLAVTSHYAHHTRLVWEHHDFHMARYAKPWHRAQHELRLARVDVSSHSEQNTGPRELLRRYRLRYETAPVRNRSFLTGVQMEGRCEVGALFETAEDQRIDQECAAPMPMPWTQMTYSAHAPRAGLQPWYLTGFCAPGAQNCDSITDPNAAAMFDVNRDGLPDVVDPKDGRVFLNPGFTPYASLTFNGRALDTTAMNLAAAAQSGNGFLTNSGGVTVAGYWGNVARTGFVWRTAVQANPARADQGKLVTVGFHPNQEPPFSLVPLQSISVPKFDLIGDLDGDGLTDSLGRSLYALPTPADDVSYPQFTKFAESLAPDRMSLFSQGPASNV